MTDLNNTKNKKMKTNKMQKLAMIYGLTAVLGSEFNDIDEHYNKKPKVKKEKKDIKPKGLSQFFYGENSVWALNKKNADKKAKKQGFFI